MNPLHHDAKTTSKLLLIGWAILLLIPASLYIFSVSMFPLIKLDTHFSQLLYLITSTGTAPYGIATGIVILIACYRCLAKPQFLQLVLAVSISMAATLSLNHFLKPFLPKQDLMQYY